MLEGLPVAGYVNMNQLAHMALQHQGLGQFDKKDIGDSGIVSDGSTGVVDFRSHPDLRTQYVLAGQYASGRQMEMQSG